MHQDYNDGILLITVWVNRVFSNNFLIKYSLLLVDDLIWRKVADGGVMQTRI